MQAIAAPSQLFFCRRIEVPEDVAEDEREGFVQLQLESLSPFPLEHLQFGYVIDEAKRFAFVYSGYRRSFENGSIAEWEKQETVIPEFSIGLLAGKQECGKPLLLVSESSIAYLEFDDLSELPCYFEAFPRKIDEDGEVESSAQSIESAQARLGDRVKGVTLRIWNANTVVHIGRQRLRLQAEEAGQDVIAIVSRDTLWTMDLRDPDRIDQAKLEERRNAIIWKVALGMAAALVLLILGELAWVGSRAYINLRKGWNEEQAPMVALIGSRQTTVFELEEFEESDLKPFDMLIAVQPFLSGAVTFLTAETNGPDSLKVTATATSQGQANQFKARLERFDKIDTVEFSKTETRSGGTSFTAIINFKVGSFSDGNEREEVVVNG